ncbi:MAG: phosphate ABC transporter permease subunit PstC [Ignavibacteria bacterium]|nr:phosphate ABC transporter permease subunit PstC [Ignavibacteria bacterium]
MNKQRLKAKIIKYFLQSCGSLSIIIVLLIFLFLFKEAFPFIGSPGIGELFHNIWNPVSFQKEEFGLFPLITGSVLVTILATVIAIPFGIIGAVYISEVASAKEREFLKPFIEILAGIPSVVLGFFGLIVIAPLIKDLFGLNTGLTALTGAVLLAFMAIPTIMSISEDAIKSVPAAYKEASLALGASKLETIWKVVVPAALSGIVASVMLGMGRVVGETMTVMMVTGNAPVISMNPFTSVRTMTATIAAEMGEVTIGSEHYMALFWVGIVLMLMTFSLNLISYRVLKKYGMIDK